MGSVTAVSTTGGAATYTETANWTEDLSDDYWTTLSYGFCSFSLKATPNDGWHFVRWERRSRDVADEYRPATYDTEEFGPEHRDHGWGDWRYISQSLEYDDYDVLIHQEQRNTAGLYYFLDRYIEYRAVFAEGDAEFTVTVTASPQAGGTVTGGGRYASGATCTVSATPANGYMFLRWELPGVTSKKTSHSFTVVGDTAATAYFRQGNGRPLHGAGGTLLFGSSGSLLFDG